MKTNIVGEFIELHDVHNNNPILIRKSEIKSVYVFGRDKNTTVIVGSREFDVVEDYEKVRAMVVNPDFISVEYTDEEKKRIEKFLEERNKTGSSSGMTDDEWHRAIAGFSDY